MVKKLERERNDTWSIVEKNGKDSESVDLNLDDDILSTSSSEVSSCVDELEHSEPVEPVEPVSNSLDTLTGSAQEQRQTIMRTANETDYEYAPLSNWSNVCLLVFTAIMSVSLTLAATKYFYVADTSQRFTPNPFTNPITNQELTFGSTKLAWPPTGKYYIDFDNQIAFPITDDSFTGWNAYKTKINILWYTTKAHCKHYNKIILKNYHATTRSIVQSTSLIKQDLITLYTWMRPTIKNKLIAFHSWTNQNIQRLHNLISSI